MSCAYRRGDGAIVIPAWSDLRPEKIVRPGDDEYAYCAERLAQLEADRQRPPAPACPTCSNPKTGHMVWGEVYEFEFIAEDSLLGGCCIPGTDEMRFPPYGCRRCGTVFDDEGHAIPRAIRP